MYERVFLTSVVNNSGFLTRGVKGYCWRYWPRRDQVLHAKLLEQVLLELTRGLKSDGAWLWQLTSCSDGKVEMLTWGLITVG
jgi:hypothetical protein